MAFRLFRVTIWMVCLFRLFFPSIDNYLGMIESFENFGIILSGNVLLTLGFLFTIIVHCRLGQEWRSGIDPEGPSRIISHSFYKYSRNPMFLGVAVSQVGFFLALPSIFTFVCLVVGLYTLNRQALAEEKHLLKVFPEEYKIYSSMVCRWI
jgi:protein-S-isoprenylcysteine O-methyltransferase Ste14